MKISHFIYYLATFVFLFTACKKEISVIGVKINMVEPVSIVIGDTLQLIATVLPENATNKTVSWTSSEPTVGIVNDNGKVFIHKMKQNDNKN